MGRVNATRGQRASTAVLALAGAVLLSGAAFVAWAALCPIEPVVDVPDAGARIARDPAAGGSGEIEPLVREVAARDLVRPAQVLAAVKDTGAAQSLLKRLQLEGVCDTGSGAVAYVCVDGKEHLSVRRGDALLSFAVADVESGRVTLSLEGVEVTLGY